MRQFRGSWAHMRTTHPELLLSKWKGGWKHIVKYKVPCRLFNCINGKNTTKPSSSPLLRPQSNDPLQHIQRWQVALSLIPLHQGCPWDSFDSMFMQIFKNGGIGSFRVYCLSIYSFLGVPCSEYHCKHNWQLSIPLKLTTLVTGYTNCVRPYSYTPFTCKSHTPLAIIFPICKSVFYC